MAPGSIRVALVDDQLISRLGLELLLAGWPPAKVVLHAGNGVEYEKACRGAPKIHVAIISLIMPERDGFETISLIRQRGERTHTIAITHWPTQEVADRAYACGASMVMCTSKLEKQFHEIVELVSRGALHRDELLDKYLTRKNKREACTPEQRIASLTKREREFLLHWASPPYPTLPEVAQRMGRQCVESLRKMVCKRLGCKRQAELIELVRKYGIKCLVGAQLYCAQLIEPSLGVFGF